jgi:REP element-mobilizing transposase RayT
MSCNNDRILPAPLAYFLTWTTYGTWLPGDERGWTNESTGQQPPDRSAQRDALHRLQESICVLSTAERQLVNATITDHCQIRGWQLHAVNCRSNHVHVVVQADSHPDLVTTQFKSWSTRRLRSYEASASNTEEPRRRWWSEGGSKRYLNDEHSLEMAIQYVLDAQ